MPSDQAPARQFQQAQTLFAQGRVMEAGQACRALCQQFPGFPGGWHLASAVALRMGRVDKALELAERALTLAPREAVLHLHRARVLLLAGRSAEARALVDAMEPREGRNPALFAELAGFHSLANEHERALPYYQQMSRLQPQRAQTWFNLAATERFLGHLDAAERAYDQGLQRAPQNFEAWYLRSTLRRQTPASNHVAELDRCRASTVDWQGQWQLDFALAKEYEDLADYASAFTALKRGADLRRAHMDYRVESDLSAFDAIIRAFAAGTDGGPPGDDCREPIFVLGLPRSGTTLVERILGSHPEVFAAGELSNFATQMTRSLQQAHGGRAQDKLQAIAASPGLDMARLGRAYVDSTRPRTGHTPRFVDKMPLNYLYIGLIARALPNASIVEVTRHPLDSCYAMYKQLFTMAYPFSYDLIDLARYYCGYRRLMRHWHALFPGRVLQLRYEDLVADQHGQTRRLLAHCGLPWNVDCLAFERNRQATTTASAAQVREGLYRSSVGKWRHYESALQPLVDALKADPEGRAALEEYC